LEFISRLKPVTYTWDIDAFCRHTGEPLIESLASNRAEASSIVYTGFLAQEVESAAKDIGFNFSGVVSPKNEHDNYGLRYAEFTVPLVKAVQEQQAEIQILESTVNDQQTQIQSLQSTIALLVAQVEILNAKAGSDK